MIRVIILIATLSAGLGGWQALALQADRVDACQTEWSVPGATTMMRIMDGCRTPASLAKGPVPAGLSSDPLAGKAPANDGRS